MKIKKNISLLFFGLLLCQAEYQILSIPKNVFQLSSNGGFNNYINQDEIDSYDKKYSFNLIHYPSDITLYDFSKDKYSI